MKQLNKIDIEPTWNEIINIWINSDMHCSNVNVSSELKKMAIICDKIRNAQKNNEKIVFDFRVGDEG